MVQRGFIKVVGCGIQSYRKAAKLSAKKKVVFIVVLEEMWDGIAEVRGRGVVALHDWHECLCDKKMCTCVQRVWEYCS